MKKSLQIPTGLVLLLISVLTSNGQTLVLAENFQGFTTGSHTTPSTSDASSSLDLKTSVPGWSGTAIYSSGGEIKIGTSSLTGWIETPSVDLSSGSGKFTVEFDIARWTGDATTVQVYYNGTALGGVITPTDNFQRIQINGLSGIIDSKIKIQGLTKRFFIDNFLISKESITTDIHLSGSGGQKVRLYPVPATNTLTISNIYDFYLIEIHDLTGKMLREIKLEGESELVVDISSFNKGIYLVVLRSGYGSKLMKFLKI